MGYIPVENLEEVSVGQNMFYPGAIHMRKDKESDIVYAFIKNKYYKISKEGIEIDDSFKRHVYEFGSNPRIINGRFIAFKLIINGRGALHFTIVDKDTNIPVLIYQEQCKGDEKIINFCYNPKRIVNRRGFAGTIGYVNEDLYNAVVNKSRLLNNPMPKTDYIKKAVNLKNKIEKSDCLPIRYLPEHENIILDNIYPQEMNKLYFISKLRYIIEEYSNGMIYYSGCLKELERKFKILVKYFKYEDVA